jgi:3-methyl-2-oxobutanoate hydroxymethyltransferase
MKTVATLQQQKGKTKITMLTAYSASTARILAEAGIDTILVGDSLGNVFQGKENTLSVTVEEMTYHTKAVRRGAPDTFLIVDMPFMAYPNAEIGFLNAGKIIKETNANAVKLEGASPDILAAVRKIVAAGIPVMGHLGFTPQSINTCSGYKVQGKEPQSAERILSEAKALVAAGVFAIVLEMVPATLGKTITESIPVPTISCGAGPHCDGQVLVVDDILGMYPKSPKFAKQYRNLGTETKAAVSEYIAEVTNGTFPAKENCF